MPVGTDAMLLGAWATLENALHIIDIGCGCGILSLICAQKSKAQIIALDTDHDSVNEARENFQMSRWHERLTALHADILTYAECHSSRFEAAICNPPFFSGDLPGRDEKRNRARHQQKLNHRALFDSVNKLLVEDGEYFLILPASQTNQTLNIAIDQGFALKKKLEIIPVAGRPANRVLFVFCKSGRTRPHTSERLVIRNHDMSYTQDFKSILSDYYLEF